MGCTQTIPDTASALTIALAMLGHAPDEASYSVDVATQLKASVAVALTATRRCESHPAAIDSSSCFGARVLKQGYTIYRATQ